MTGGIASLNGTTFPALELQGRTCQRESRCVEHAVGSEGWLGHYMTWFVSRVGEFLHFTWGLESKQCPCIWGIITLFFYSKANAPYFPGVGGVGVSIDRCISTYKDMFEGFGHIGNASFVIADKCTAVQHAPQCIPVTIRTEVRERVIIKKETEPTDWISSMVVVAKPNKIRICLDPKDLNKALKKPKYQMPTLEELLPKLNNAKVFSTLDAKDGFYKIALDDASSKLTTFWTPFGRYRYLRMPFGISTAPDEFECKLQENVADLPGVEVLRDDMSLAIEQLNRKPTEITIKI